MDSVNDSKLYKEVFGNIVLFRKIYLYKNKCVFFNSRELLLEYKEREYISTLEYTGSSLLKVGDLPINGVLNKILIANVGSIKGDVIPYGVEEINFSSIFYNSHITAPLSSFPSTVHTVKSVVILPYQPNTIPPNITSISFDLCPKIINTNRNGDTVSTIPNTVKKLKFVETWNNDGLFLSKGDLPDGLTSLSMLGFKSENLGDGALPNTIKELAIICSSDRLFNNDLVSNCSNIQYLNIYCNNNITPESNLKSFISLKKLKIKFKYKTATLEANSLPSSITNLRIINLNSMLLKDMVPNNVKILELNIIRQDDYDPNYYIKGSIPNSVTELTINRKINQPGIFPDELIKFEILENISQKDIETMKPLFPQSLISFSAPYKPNIKINR